MKFIAVMLLSLSFTTAAQAQNVWRCGPDARSYSDSPCTDGTTMGRMVAVADPRNPAQIQAAHDVVARDRELARHMAQERRDNEHEALSRTGLAGIKSAAPAAVKVAVRPPKKKLRQRSEEPGTWPSTAHASRHARG